MGPDAKRHAACDECRNRKLKCSGEPTGCVRCMKQNIACHYSVQKQMGRPKKRQRTENDAPSTLRDSPTSDPRETLEPVIDPGLTSADVERTDFHNVCPGPLSQAVRRSTVALSTRPSDPGALFSHSANTSPSEQPITPPDHVASYPTDISNWPDFSSMETLPMLVQDSHRKQPTSSGLYSFTDPDADPEALSALPPIPACPCLPNLYLTLSTLSTLSSFPVSTHTIETLLAAHRTCRAVIYCTICPQKFQSGSQNVMLVNTLLTVLADNWHRIRKASAEDLRIGFASEVPEKWEPLSIRMDLEWRTFGHSLLRAHVFGDQPPPTPPSTLPSPSPRPFATSGQGAPPSSEEIMSSRDAKIPTLNGLCNAMERRQLQWHGRLPPERMPSDGTLEFAPRITDDHLAHGHSAGMTLEEIRKCEEKLRTMGEDEMLCVRLTRHNAALVSSLDTPVPRLTV